MYMLTFLSTFAKNSTLMIKKILIVSIIISCTQSLLGQGFSADFQKGASHFLSFSAGLAIPGGRFSNSTLYENYNNSYDINTPKLPRTGPEVFNVIGFADVGTSLSFSGAGFFSKFFGIGLRTSVSINPLSTNKLKNEYSNAFQNSSFSFDNKNSYISALAMPGFYFQLPINDNLTADINAGYGVQYIKTPEIHCNYTYNNVNFKEVTYSSTNWDFSYYVSIGMKYRIDKHLGISIDLIYNELAMDMEFITDINKTSVTNNHDLFYIVPSINIGLNYLFK